MSNGNRTRKTICDIILFMFTHILKSGNTIPKSIYFRLHYFFAIVGVGIAVISKSKFLRDARFVVCSVLSCYWTCFVDELM